jgi:hypothetical protein
MTELESGITAIPGRVRRARRDGAPKGTRPAP